MKKSAKKLILWGAAAAAGALGFTACRNKPETVYGPPSYFNPDPSENIPQDVYGPPPLEETETDDVTASETDAASCTAASCCSGVSGIAGRSAVIAPEAGTVFKGSGTTRISSSSAALLLR